MPHSSDETNAKSPFSAHTIERSLSLSLSAIRPPSNPKIMEKGPLMSSEGKALAQENFLAAVFGALVVYRRPERGGNDLCHLFESEFFYP